MTEGKNFTLKCGKMHRINKKCGKVLYFRRKKAVIFYLTAIFTCAMINKKKMYITVKDKSAVNLALFPVG